MVLLNEGLMALVRGFIGFFTLLIFTRILGKQQISQLTFFDYIVGVTITIGSTASSLTTDFAMSCKALFIFVTIINHKIPHRIVG